MDVREHSESSGTNRAELSHKTPMKVFINLFAVLMLMIAGYFAYAIMTRSSRTTALAKEQAGATRIIQLDVLNGCGTKGAGAKMMSRLRLSGFDVVEMKNYKTFGV